MCRCGAPWQARLIYVCMGVLYVVHGCGALPCVASIGIELPGRGNHARGVAPRDAVGGRGERGQFCLNRAGFVIKIKGCGVYVARSHWTRVLGDQNHDFSI